MEAVFLSLIGQLNGSVFTLVVILVLMFFVVYKLGGVVKSYKDFESSKEKNETKMDDIKTSLAKITATTDLLYQSHLSTVKSTSPLKLTDKGVQVSTAIGAEEKVANHWEEIKKVLEGKHPVNPYDIQVIAMDIARRCFDKIFTPAEQDVAKTYAFKTGLNLLEIYPVIAIIIRDKIFQERNMSLGEIDKHDPSSGQSKSEF